jgi:hypothetical protein
MSTNKEVYFKMVKVTSVEILSNCPLQSIFLSDKSQG